MVRWKRPIFILLLMVSLAACSLTRPEEDVQVAAAATLAASNMQLSPTALNRVTAVSTAAFTPTSTPSATATATATATHTPTPTATPVIKPANINVETLRAFSRDSDESIVVQHPLFGQVYVIDQLSLDTPFMISWTDDNPQTAVVRFRNEDGVRVELTARVDPGHGELAIEPAEDASGQAVPGRQLRLNSADVFSAIDQIERLVTVELTDEDGNSQPVPVLFSRHDYVEGYTGPMELAQPQYDQLELGIDWHSEQYAPQGAYAEWLNSQPDLWNRVTMEIEGREPISWRDLRSDNGLLHQELAAAEYDAEIAFYYMTADGESQLFTFDRTPYYTKFEIVHSPRDEEEFYTIRAGRDPEVTEGMLHEMGEVVRHMFSNRPDYLHDLAVNKGVHSVAPGKDMRVLPEISILPDDIIALLEGNDDFGVVTGIALLERHEELSASAGYYFENDTPVLGFTLMHELVHQVQYMIYGPSWGRAVERYYVNYMELPERERIPDVDYYETSPWEWDALLTPAWFSQGSLLYEHVEPYMDLEVGDTGTTIREHLQRHWGDPLPVYAGE